MPHLRIKVKANYTLDEIRACINSRLLGNNSPIPKVKGKIIPAPMVRARSKNTGALSSTAAKAELTPQISGRLTGRMSGQNVAALPH